MGILISVTNNYWSVVIANLQKAQKIRARPPRILGREGVDTWTLGSFYLSILQAALLFGAETWVVTPHIRYILGGLHHRVARKILKKKPRRREDGTCYYPHMGKDMWEVG